MADRFYFTWKRAELIALKAVKVVIIQAACREIIPGALAQKIIEQGGLKRV